MNGGVNPEMFGRIANVQNYNDKQQRGLLNTGSIMLFGKPVDQLGDFANGLMTVLGQYFLNSYGDMLGVHDAGQDFAVLHQAISSTSNFKPMDQNGRLMTGSIQGPGAVSLGITRTLNEMVNDMHDPENMNSEYITGGLAQVTTAQAVGQILRERNGLRDGEYIHMQNVRPGAEGAEKALSNAVSHGLNKNNPSVQEMVKAIAATKAQDAALRLGEDDERIDRHRKSVDALNKAKGDFKENKISKKDLDEAIANEEKARALRTAGTSMQESVTAYNKAQDKVDRLQEQAKSGKDVTLELATAESERDVAKLNMENKSKEIASDYKKYLLPEKVAGMEVGEMNLDDVDQSVIQSVRQGKVDASGITDSVVSDIEEGLKNASKNLKELADAFETDNFEELQRNAELLSMGSIVASKNAENVARRIRTAKAEAERTGRTTKDIFDEQIAISAVAELVTGYKPGAATVERIQRQREQGNRNILTGATTLTREEIDAKIFDAESIMQRENQELFNSHHLMKKLENTEDPEQRAVKKQYDALEKQFEEAKTPEERDYIKQQMLDLARNTFGYNMTTSELVSRQANKEDIKYQEKVKQSIKDQVTTQEDANYYKNNIKNSTILREQYEKRYGENWEQVAEAEYGQIAKTYGNEYDKFDRDRSVGASQRTVLESKLTEVNRELVHKKEREIEDLKEQHKYATDPHEKARLRDEIDHAEVVLDQLGGDDYAAARRNIEEQTNKELEKYAETLRNSGDYSEEQIAEAVEARRKTIEYSRSTDATKRLSLDNIKDTSQQSRTAVASESMESRANAKLNYRDQFEKELETDREETYTKSFMQEMVAAFVKDGKHLTKQTALASYMQTHLGDSLKYSETTGNAIVDTEKLNDLEADGIAALKVNATDEEKKEYAANSKIREMLGVNTEEEALDLLNNPTKLQDRLIHLSDSNKMFVTRMGEGEGTANILVSSSKMDTMTAAQQKDIEKIKDLTKYLTGTAVEKIDADAKGLHMVQANGVEMRDEREINEWISKQAVGGSAVRKNLEELAKSDDKATAAKATKLLQMHDEYSELNLFNGKDKVDDNGNVKAVTIGDIQDVMGKNFDKKWENIDDKQKESFGSESAYNLARAQIKQKTYAFEQAMANNDGKDKDKILEIAKNLGIKGSDGKEWDGDVSKLSAKDQSRIAVEYGQQNKDWFKNEWNKLDWMNTEEGLKQHRDATGKIKFNGIGDKDSQAEEFSIDANDATTKQKLTENMIRQGAIKNPNTEKENSSNNEGILGNLMTIANSIFEVIKLLASCVSPTGSLKVINNN